MRISYFRNLLEDAGSYLQHGRTSSSCLYIQYAEEDLYGVLCELDPNSNIQGNKIILKWIVGESAVMHGRVAVGGLVEIETMLGPETEDFVYLIPFEILDAADPVQAAYEYKRDGGRVPEVSADLVKAIQTPSITPVVVPQAVFSFDFVQEQEYEKDSY